MTNVTRLFDRAVLRDIEPDRGYTTYKSDTEAARRITESEILPSQEVIDTLFANKCTQGMLACMAKGYELTPEQREEIMANPQREYADLVLFHAQHSDDIEQLFIDYCYRNYDYTSLNAMADREVFDVSAYVDHLIDRAYSEYVVGRLRKKDFQFTGPQFEHAAEQRLDDATKASLAKGYQPHEDEVDALINNKCRKSLLLIAKTKPELLDAPRLVRCIHKDMDGVVEVVMKDHELDASVIDAAIRTGKFRFLHRAARGDQAFESGHISELIKAEAFNTVGILVLKGIPLTEDQFDALRQAGFNGPLVPSNIPTSATTRNIARSTSPSSSRSVG